MKIKNSNDKLKLSSMFPVMFGSTLVLIVLRSLLVAKFIDSETGFLTGGEFINTIFYVILAAVCIFFTGIAFLSSESKKVELIGLKDKPAAIACIAFALSLAYDWFNSLSESLMTISGMNFDVYYKTSELFKAMMSSGALPYALQSIFALFTAIYIAILAKSFLNGSGHAYNHKFIALAPIGWACFKLITRFVKQISYIKVSDLLLELFMLAFAVTFFVALSQVVSGVYCDETRWRITALGLSGAVISLSVNIPRLVFTLFASDFVNKEYPFNLADTVFAVFAVLLAMAAVKSVKEKAIEA